MNYRWSLVVFSARELVNTLMRTVHAACAACDERTPIDVIVNGNKALADAACSRSARIGANVRIWYLQTPDKALAWNQYVEHIWPPSEVAFFIDGYVRVMPDALRLLAARFADDKEALSVSAVPTDGWSAASLRERMASKGGLHGNLFALRGEALHSLRVRGFKLPLGIYRTDALLGAIMAFNLDPGSNTWDSRRTAVQSSATWRVDSPDMLTRFVDGYRRTLRQAQGRLETLAIHQHLAVERKAPEQLPRTVSELVGEWVKCHRSAARATFLRNPLCYVAARRLVAPGDRSSLEHSPQLLRAEAQVSPALMN